MSILEINLRELQIDDKEVFLESIQNFADTEFEFAHYFNEVHKGNWDTFFPALADYKKGENLPYPDHVPSTQLYAFNEQGLIVGRASLRHELNEFLANIGGHIGYIVHPDFRRRGIGTQILQQTLDYTRVNLPQMKKVLVTCDDANRGSNLIIRRNKGRFEGQISQGEGKPLKNRYWIRL